MKDLIEDAVLEVRFNLLRLLKAADIALGRGPCADALRVIKAAVRPREYEYLVRSLVRWTFLIELVKQPGIKTTKFEMRWAERLPIGDPRHASYEECWAAFCDLAEELASSLDSPDKTAVWREFFETRLLPYELPIDYRERRTEVPIHRAENLCWLWDNAMVREAVKLRKAVLDRAVVGVEAKVFALTLKKIKVKTYLTDRALTGIHKTNREKRWEVHPASVQFALRRDCLGIERELLEQLCFFRGFPDAVRQTLQGLGVLREREETRCPVTLAPLDYVAFVAAVKDPDHGRANFQVGHLNPLKAIPGDGASGHTAKNIAWVSADGNRIQGHYSIEQTRAMLREIAERYIAMGWAVPGRSPDRP